MIKPRKYQTKDKEGVKQFISEILEDIFKSDAKGLEDLNDITNNFEVFYVAEKDNTLIGTIGIKREDGSARIFLDSSVLVEVFLNGILKNFVNLIKNPRNESDIKILKGFLRGLAAAEGSVTLTKLKSLSRIGISFDPNSDELNLYKIILKNIGIKCGGIKGNELYFYGINNFKIFNNIDLFKMHDTRREKFLLGFKNHKFCNSN